MKPDLGRINPTRPSRLERHVRGTFFSVRRVACGSDYGARRTLPVGFVNPDLQSGIEGREDQVASLQKTMTGELRHLEGFRVGEIQINIFVLEQGDSREVDGLRTFSVET